MQLEQAAHIGACPCDERSDSAAQRRSLLLGWRAGGIHVIASRSHFAGLLYCMHE